MQPIMVYFDTENYILTEKRKKTDNFLIKT